MQEYIIIAIPQSTLQIAPTITEGNTPYVHHILLYLCSELNHTVVGQSSECDSAHIQIQECRNGQVIAGWAIGGNVNETANFHISANNYIDCLVCRIFNFLKMLECQWVDLGPFSMLSLKCITITHH